jgi:pyrroline-5-carboxylate reductase
VIALSGGHWANRRELKQAQEIFGLIGKVFLIKESLMDAVTAVSGSGPGYIYFFAEQMIASAKKLGFARSVAEDLVIQTFVGSVLLMVQSKESPDRLCAQVASKGGTTQEALNVLLNKKMDRVFYQALKSARDRSQMLSRKLLCAK